MGNTSWYFIIENKNAKKLPPNYSCYKQNARSMKFSVIIPCYNSANTIVRALDSLTQQKITDWEVICIDDCSKDNTEDIIKTYSEQHKNAKITLLCNEINSGPGISRNSGIAIAQGDYLCFLDADDFYDLSFFDVLDKKIAQTDADIVFYGCNQIIGKTVRKRPFTQRNSIPDYLALVGGNLWGGAWRRTLWEGIEIPSIKNAEDIAVIPVLISKSKTIVTVESLLYTYVHSNSSLSSVHNSRVSYNFVESFHYTLQHIDFNSYHDSVEFHGIKTIIYGATINAIKARMSNNEIQSLWFEFESLFPDWINNKYLKSYSRIKRVFVLLVSKRLFALMRFYAHLHNYLLLLIG